MERSAASAARNDSTSEKLLTQHLPCQPSSRRGGFQSDSLTLQVAKYWSANCKQGLRPAARAVLLAGRAQGLESFSASVPVVQVTGRRNHLAGPRGFRGRFAHGTEEGKQTTRCSSHFDIERGARWQCAKIDSSLINRQIGRVMTPASLVAFRNSSRCALESSRTAFSQ